MDGDSSPAIHNYLGKFIIQMPFIKNLAKQVVGNARIESIINLRELLLGESAPEPPYTSIGRIKSKILSYGDYAYADRYRIIVYPNNRNINTLAGYPSEKIALNCNAVSLPGKSIFTAENNNLLGPTRKYPYKQLFDDITMTFYCDENLIERIYFEQWHSLVYNQDTKEISYYDDFIGEIDIQVLSRNTGEPTYVIRLNEAYPITIQPIELGYDNENTIMKQSVTFAYRTWERAFDKADIVIQRGPIPEKRRGPFNLDLNINEPIPLINGRVGDVNLPLGGLGQSKIGIGF